MPIMSCSSGRTSTLNNGWGHWGERFRVRVLVRTNTIMYAKSIVYQKKKKKKSVYIQWEECNIQNLRFLIHKSKVATMYSRL